MKTRSRRAELAIHGVSIAVAVIVVFSFASVFYSAYADYRGISNSVSSPEYHHIARTMNGSAETITVSLTIPNNGLYSITVSAACPEPDAEGNITCRSSPVTVPAGQQRVLTFVMTVKDLALFENSLSQQVNGTVSIQLAPFASMTVTYGLGNLVKVIK